jgi:hypothetical protein
LQGFYCKFNYKFYELNFFNKFKISSNYELFWQKIEINRLVFRMTNRARLTHTAVFGNSDKFYIETLERHFPIFLLLFLYLLKKVLFSFMFVSYFADNRGIRERRRRWT